MNSKPIHGALVELPLGGKIRPLNGFWTPGHRKSDTLLIYVHGMGSNFYSSPFRKRLMRDATRHGHDMLLFNNRGAEGDVATERFRDCLADIDAALRFGRQAGYEYFVLIGHSTGCQKIAYHQAVRNNPRVKALILTSIGDDYAIVRRDLGRRFAAAVKMAKSLVRRGKGDAIMPRDVSRFSAQRFLSIADPGEIEAQLFNFAGDLRHFRKLTLPMLALFPEQEEFACIPVRRAAAILMARTRAARFDAVFVPDANHGFHGAEAAASRAIFHWLKKVGA